MLPALPLRLLCVCASLALAACNSSTNTPHYGDSSPVDGDGDEDDNDSGDGDHHSQGDGDDAGDGDGDSGDGDSDGNDPGDGDGDSDGDGDGDGDGSGDGDGDEPAVDAQGHRLISSKVLARKAIAYSGYRQNQSPDAQSYPSEAQIREDLNLLIQAGFGLIRLFDSSEHGARVLKVIDDDKLDLKATLGIWIAGGKAEHDAENRADIERGVMLANAHPNTVVGVSVGNETLDSWSSVRTPPEDLVAYIEVVRARVKQPVTTDDLYPPFLLGKDGDYDYGPVLSVIQAVDYLSVHIYPFLDAPWGSWEWKLTSVPLNERPRAMMDAAFAYAKEQIAAVKSASKDKGIDIPILIGEAGWKDKTFFTADSDDEQHAVEPYLSSPLNQKWMVDDFESWVYGDGKSADGPLALFYFEAFDEPWKDGDDHWGLFDVNRKAKYALWSRVPELKPEGADTPDASDAVCFR
jgi:exo-beta-1,3-glucanase (GH17 family)